MMATAFSHQNDTGSRHTLLSIWENVILKVILNLESKLDWIGYI